MFDFTCNTQNSLLLTRISFFIRPIIHVLYSKGVPTINQGARQECRLLPTPFNICVDDMLEHGKLRHIQGYNRTILHQHALFTDEQIILQNSEHTLQTAVCKIAHIDKNYSFKVHANKKKTGVQRKVPQPNKNVIDNESLEQAPHFTYVTTPH